jgi:hypothetical protein
MTAIKQSLALAVILAATLLLRPVYANLPVAPAPSPLESPLVDTAGEGAGEQPRQPFTLWLPVMRSQ